jgi:arylsulfatase A-like enzyme
MLNYFDVHDPYCTVHPYDPRFSTEPFRGDVINFQFQPQAFRRKPVVTPDEANAEADAYDDCLAYLDAHIGDLLEEFRRRNLDQNTIVVITSDHGESLGDHDLFGHGQSLYIDTLHVPLILYRPGHVPADLRVRGVVGLNDLPATLASLAAPNYSHPFPGRSLVRFFDNPTAPGDVVLARVNAGRLTGGELNYPTARGGLNALVTDDAHLIVSDSGHTELYDWRRDPAESNDLARSPDHQALLQSMRARLDQLIANPSPAPTTQPRDTGTRR